MTITAASSSPVTIGDLQVSGTEDSGVRWSRDPLVGWAGSPSSTMIATRKPRGHGAWGSEPFLPERVIIVSGTVAAPTGALLSDAIDRLNTACSLTDTTLSVSESGRVRTCTVRRQDDVIVTQVNARFARWSAQLVALDPRKYGQVITDSTALPSTTGGLIVPYTVPYTIGATAVAGKITINNPGNIPSPVNLRIDGPCSGPIITHLASGSYLKFASSYEIATGAWLEIDMENRTVKENGQSSRNGYITQRGWFSFDPGVNTIGFNAAAYDADALLTATVNPAYF